MKPTPKGWPRMSSCVVYEDPHRAIDWLCQAFGFEVRLKVEDDKGAVAHSELTFGDGVVMVSGPREEPRLGSLKSPGQVGGANTQSIMIYVDDVEAHQARAAAAGATITDPVSLHDYGEDHWADKSYGARDLGGHHWWFTQRVRGA